MRRGGPGSIACATLSAITLALAGCGGGGSSGGGSAPIAAGGTGASPTPTPSPPSTVSNLPPAPFGITATTPFAIVGWQQRSPDGQPTAYSQAADRGQLTWSATLRTYTLTLADLDSGSLAYTFPNGSNNAAFSVIKADGATGNVYVTIIPETGSLGKLFWQSADGVRPFVYAKAIFGVPISPSMLPASGRRVFVTGNAPVSELVIDFATRKVSGTIIEQFQNGWDPDGPIEQATLIPADLRADGSFVAVFTIPGTAIQGELRGQLMGSAGNELAVYWNGPVRGPYGPEFENWRDVASFVACAGCT